MFAASSVAVLDTPLETETGDYNTRLGAEGGTVTAATTNAINKFIRAGKANGWWTKLIDCAFFIGPDLTSALVKLKVAPGTSDSCLNRGSGLDGAGAPWSGTAFQEANYDPQAGINKPTESPLREIGTEVNLVDQGLGVNNFSIGMVADMSAMTAAFYLGGGNLASGQPELLFIPYAAFNGYFGLRIDLSAPVMQWCESDSFGLSYGPSSAIGAHDGQGFQDTTLGTPTNDLDSEFTLFQMTSFGPLKYTSANYTLGGYFVGEFLTRAELESLTLEMKLIHHRARGIVRTPLWVGIGDSITFGAGVSDSWDNGWFQQSAFAHGARKHVSAIFGGLTVGSAVGAVNTGLPVEHRYLKLKNISPDVVTVLCGTNDQDPTIVDATTNGNPTLIAAYQAGLTTILTEIKTWGTTAVMLSPPYNERDTLTKQLVYASAAMAAASAAGVTGINVVLEMVSTGDPGQFFDADPIHPNQAGHNFISSLLLAQIPV